jgi:hypothetical protein
MKYVAAAKAAALMTVQYSSQFCPPPDPVQ